MIKKIFTLALIISTLGYSSCKKETTTEPPVQIDNHINFKANGTQVNASFKVILQDPVFNAYYKQSNAVDMQRLVENGNPQRLVFAIDRIDLDNTVFPITINYSTKFDEPTVSVTYVDENNLPFGTNINNGQDFTLVINGYSENVINCSFNGTLFSGITTNPTTEITEGDLNLELVVY
jgi:hypothetical protein